MNAYDIFQRLEKRAHRSGFTMTAVSRRAGIQPALISRWRAGTVEPRLSTIDKLENALIELRAERK